MRINPDHNPYARPLGCNGKYGRSGARAHRYKGEPACTPCLTTEAHYTREYRSGGIKKGTRKLAPCGTAPAAPARHRKRKEPLCFPCRVAEAAYWANQRAKAKEPTCTAAPNAGTTTDKATRGPHAKVSSTKRAAASHVATVSTP